MHRRRYSQLENALAQVVKQLRLDADLTQDELARRCRRPQSFVAKIESGQRRVSAVDIVMIAEALRTTTAPAIICRLPLT